MLATATAKATEAQARVKEKELELELVRMRMSSGSLPFAHATAVTPRSKEAEALGEENKALKRMMKDRSPQDTDSAQKKRASAVSLGNPRPGYYRPANSVFVPQPRDNRQRLWKDARDDRNWDVGRGFLTQQGMVSHIPLAQQWPAAIEGLGLELLQLHDEAGIGSAWEITGDNLNLEWMSSEVKV